MSNFNAFRKDLLYQKYQNMIIPVSSSAVNTTSSLPNIEDFFNLYNTLFFDIPISGSEYSHYSIGIKSLLRAGIDVEEMMKELDDLLQENTNLRKVINNINNTNNEV
ncbi:MAG: hypothetical protein IRZ03_15705 [Acidobacterium ailaaui]|nr:hypothetical protein [Pseudacidobacterium ailaaui]